MKQFTTIEKLDTGILYLLELASSLSVFLLAFGLEEACMIFSERSTGRKTFSRHLKRGFLMSY